MIFGANMYKTLIILYFYFKTKYFNNFKDRNTLLKWQNKKTQKFLSKILKKSKHYNDKFKNLDIKNWQDFPTIDKKEMMENFDTLNTVNISKKEAFELALNSEKTRDFKPEINNVTVGLSSGTSGNRGIFLASKFEQYRWVGTVLAKTLPYSIFKKHRIAFFLRVNSNLYQNIQSRKICFKYFDMLNSIEENLKKLDDFKPTIIAAPPSMLKIIAKNLFNLKINPVKIISVAEVLEDIDKKYLEKAFTQTIHQIYQATEGFLACTCKCGNLHLNEDMIAIQKEFVGENKFVPIITDFRRTSEPIIRYRLNDILTEGKTPCPCGSKHLVIEKIEGRCDDIFHLESAVDNSMVSVFPDFISRTIIFSSDKIEEYKVIQTSKDEVQVYINNDSEFDTVKKSLAQLFEKMNCKVPNIVKLDTLSIDNSKKFKRIECKINGQCIFI